MTEEKQKTEETASTLRASLMLGFDDGATGKPIQPLRPRSLDVRDAYLAGHLQGMRARDSARQIAVNWYPQGTGETP